MRVIHPVAQLRKGIARADGCAPPCTGSMMTTVELSVSETGRGERRMNSATAENQRISLERQVVLGHLLPRYQAATDWQDSVRVQRALPCATTGGRQQIGRSVVTRLCDVARGWRRHHWYTFVEAVARHSAGAAHRLSIGPTLTCPRSARAQRCSSPQAPLVKEAGSSHKRSFLRRSGMTVSCAIK